MEKKNERGKEEKPGSSNKSQANKSKNTFADLTDNQHDMDRMKSEEFVIDMPEVSDIPGQEHIHVPRIREMEDVTCSSDDEEGVGIFGEDGKEDFIEGTDADISKDERERLERTDKEMPSEDEQQLRRATLDKTDADGDPLNEGGMGTDKTGEDLDTSGIDEDNRMEDIGEEDEENNLYSLGGDNHDDDR
jgi:hypothetical protein